MCHAERAESARALGQGRAQRTAEPTSSLVWLESNWHREEWSMNERDVFRGLGGLLCVYLTSLTTTWVRGAEHLRLQSQVSDGTGCWPRPI